MTPDAPTRRRRRAWLAVGIVTVALALVLAAAAFLVPALPLLRLFDDAHRAERFRTLHELIPSQAVRAGDDPWPFTRAERPLPDTFEHLGAQRSLQAFLDASETTGLLVARDGVIVHESYARGNDAASLATSFSVAKSFTSALVGIALERGLIASLDDAIDAYVPELAAGGYEGVPIRDVLVMASGVAWNEDYDDPNSDVMRQLPVRLFVLRQAAPGVLAGVTRERAPGGPQRYASVDTLALGLLLERVTGVALGAFLEEALWQPAGMASRAAWGTDHHGNALAYAFLGATLEDYARFGRLYLHGGRRDGVEVVPASWVEASLTPARSSGPDGAFGAGFGYGIQWWLPPDGEHEALALGIYGQAIYLDRGLGVVIVKTGTDPGFLGRQGETLAAFRAIASAVGGADR